MDANPIWNRILEVHMQFYYALYPQVDTMMRAETTGYVQTSLHTADKLRVHTWSAACTPQKSEVSVQ